MFNDDTPALTQAIAIWRAGRRISLILYARLREDGYDVPSLERAYSPR